MADISAELTAFQNAVYGEDVRSAMVSLANKLNTVVTDGVEDVETAVSNLDVFSEAIANNNEFSTYLYKSSAFLNSNLEWQTNANIDTYRIPVKDLAQIIIYAKTPGDTSMFTGISGNYVFRTETDGVISALTWPNNGVYSYVDSVDKIYIRNDVPWDYLYVAILKNQSHKLCVHRVYKNSVFDKTQYFVRNSSFIDNSIGFKSVLYVNSQGGFSRTTSTYYTYLIPVFTDDKIFYNSIAALSGLSYRVAYSGYGTDTQVKITDDYSIPADGILTVFYSSSDAETEWLTIIPAKRPKVIWNDIYDKPNIESDNPYNGMSGVAFGTSLTYRAQTTGGFLTRIESLSGITFDNKGDGSSGFLTTGHDGTTIISAIKNYTSYASKDLVLIEGSVNDWYGQKALGTYTDTEETTVCGCLRSCINYILTKNPSIMIFVLLDHYGNGITAEDVIKNNLTQYQYYEEMVKVCDAMGIPCLKWYAVSGLNNKVTYMQIDNIHLNSKGVEHIGNLTWDFIRRFTPKVKNS